MFHFHQNNKGIFLKEFAIQDLIEQFPTPFYLYDLDGLTETAKKIQSFMQAHSNILICYALKANAGKPICQVMLNHGLGFDVVSGHEIEHLLELSADPSTFYFSGVGKTKEEIDLAIRRQIAGFNVESMAELNMIEARSRDLQEQTSVGLRWNPDTPVDTHPNLRTGTHEDKFGLDTEQVLQAIDFIKQSSHLVFSGIHLHIGSQLLDIDIFRKSFLKAKEFATELASRGVELTYLDIGGGLGIHYESDHIAESTTLLDAYLEALSDIFQDVPYRVISELGRALVGIYGALVAQVLYAKENPSNNFLICNASMTELIRPVLYGARHPIWHIPLSTERHDKTYQLTSPICESGDVFADAFYCKFKPTYGDPLVILCAGAYGSCMANRYNLRPLPKEIYSKDGKLFSA